MLTILKKFLVLFFLLSFPTIVFAVKDPFYNTVVEKDAADNVTSIVTTGLAGKIEIKLSPVGTFWTSKSTGKTWNVEVTMWDAAGIELNSISNVTEGEDPFYDISFKVDNNMVKNIGTDINAHISVLKTEAGRYNKLIVNYKSHSDNLIQYEYTIGDKTGNNVVKLSSVLTGTKFYATTYNLYTVIPMDKEVYCYTLIVKKVANLPGSRKMMEEVLVSALLDNLDDFYKKS